MVLSYPTANLIHRIKHGLNKTRLHYFVFLDFLQLKSLVKIFIHMIISQNFFLMEWGIKKHSQKSYFFAMENIAVYSIKKTLFFKE